VIIKPRRPRLWMPNRREVCRGLVAAPFILRARPSDAQGIVFNGMAALRSAYVALRYGFLIHFNMYTFSQTHAANQAINTFAPSTTNFIAQWVTTAQAAGIKYCGLTAKHIDGFCIWNTASTNYNVTQTTWYQSGGGFDIVGQFCTQMRAAGIAPVLYFSMSDNTYSGGFSGSGLSALNYAKLQLTELLTNYGAIAGIWSDPDYGSGPNNSLPFLSDGQRNTFIHNLQPNCLDLKNSHVGNLGLSLADIILYEAVQPTNQLAYPQEMAETSFGPNTLWFWQPGYTLKPVGDHNTAGTMANDMFITHNRNGTFTAGVGPNQTGAIPSDIVTQLTSLGTFN
jgi:alpha-L-fucosidase